MKQKNKALTLSILFSFVMLIVSCGDGKPKEPIVIYTVGAVTNKDYEISGGGLSKEENPTLTLKRGETYKFIITAEGHPFFIKTEKVTGKISSFDEGVTNNGTSDGGILLFSVPKNAPDALYYVCQYHKMMSGELKIID